MSQAFKSWDHIRTEVGSMDDEWDRCCAAYRGEPNALLPWMMMVLSTYNYLVGALRSRGLPDDQVYRGVEDSISKAFTITYDSFIKDKMPKLKHRKRWFWRKSVKASERWMEKNHRFLPPPPPTPPSLHLTSEQEKALKREAELIGGHFDLLYKGSEDGLFLEYALKQGLGAVLAGERIGISPEEAEERFAKLIDRLADCSETHNQPVHGPSATGDQDVDRSEADDADPWEE